MDMSAPAPWDAVARGYDRTTRANTEAFCRRALELANLPDGAHVLDVATGPATLPLLAAERATHVLGVDFAEAMVARARANTAHLPQVTVRQGDGQALQLEPVFHGAFSVFGLIFFPDRAAGFRSLHRALRPDGVAVVVAWPPIEASSAMVRMVGALQAAFPDAPAPEPDPDALDSADKLVAEMRAAGFTDVTVHEHTHVWRATADELWAMIADGFAPVVWSRRSLPEGAWQQAEARGRAWLAEHHTDGEPLAFVGLLGRGVR